MPRSMSWLDRHYTIMENNKKSSCCRNVLSIVLGFYLALLLWITVINRETIEDNVFRFKPLHSIASIGNELASGGMSGNFFGNILLFVPIGFLGTYVFKIKKVRYICGVGFFFSLLIEICQAIFSKGYFEIDDLLTNTVGTLIGYCSLHVMLYLIRTVKRRK